MPAILRIRLGCQPTRGWACKAQLVGVGDGLDQHSEALTRTSLLRKGRAAEPQRSMAMVYSCGQPVGLLAPW